MVRRASGQITYIDVSDGDTGGTGPRTAEGVVWFQTAQSSQPAAPSATSYNFANGELTGLSSGWLKTQPE